MFQSFYNLVISSLKHFVSLTYRVKRYSYHVKYLLVTQLYIIYNVTWPNVLIRKWLRINY